MNKVELIQGDCIDKLKELKDNSIDSVVTDPPYEIGFMGKGWDDSGIANNPELWKEVLRVLKPGGHLLSFSHSRTYHRQAVAVEDAGFEIRDQIMWIYGSGFPKSHNIGKSVDKILGNDREVVGTKIHSQKGVKVAEERTTIGAGAFGEPREADITKGNSPYEGWGTALKPAHEPIVMARKPLSEKTIAKNVLEHGTGGINIDGCRVGTDDTRSKASMTALGQNSGWNKHSNKEVIAGSESGRFPANIIFDEEAGKILDEQSGFSKSKSFTSNMRDIRGNGEDFFTSTSGNKRKVRDIITENGHNDEGGASRFFYCPKASKKDRNDGLDIVEQKNNRPIGTAFTKDDNLFDQKVNNFHPTVKPTDLMAYLVRLVTPKGGTVLDPFMGSGSTGKASVREGFNFVGIEREDEYMEIAKTRIEHEQSKNKHHEFFDAV